MVVSCALAHRFSSVVDTVVVIIVGFIAPLCTTYFPAVHIHTPCHDSHSFYARDTHFSRALRHPVLHIDDFYFTSPSSFILYLIYIYIPPHLAPVITASQRYPILYLLWFYHVYGALTSVLTAYLPMHVCLM